MTPRERVLTALKHKNPDRCPCDYVGTPEVDKKLKAPFDHMQNRFEFCGWKV